MHPDPRPSPPDADPEIRGALERLNALLRARDPELLAEFTACADMLLIGSEAEEIVEGRPGFEGFVHSLFALPVTLGWEWSRVRVAREQDLAWVFARGELVIRDVEGERRKPYRMTGVLQRRDGRWRWRMFHGSEPAA